MMLPLGMNLYIYQICYIEKQVDNDFGQLTGKERKQLRKAYLFVLAQYLVLFALFGGYVTP
ncbi:hypothetical protein [Virgibacillus salexigens]|nr:hypothetical protein [Virgibacillus kapii]GGJ74124.1 hypothetical protein GCM10007111_39650 [Virgibacillus kapii]